MQTFRNFVKSEYDNSPRLQEYYGSFEQYFSNYYNNHYFREWLETLRNTQPSLGFVNSIARNYIQLAGFKPSDISQILVNIHLQYDMEIPAVEGILTQDYWIQKARQMHWIDVEKSEAA